VEKDDWLLIYSRLTGSPYEVEPLVVYLRERTDWTLICPTLPGHGESQTLKGIHFRQWLDHAEVELNKLFQSCDVVYVIGFSMGGLIACFLAANYPVDKLILLSAAAYYINPKQLTADLLEIGIDLINGNLPDNELFSRYKRKITETPLATTRQFRSLVSFINQTNAG
jgi:carboxylesterase